MTRHDGPPVWKIEGTRLGDRFKKHLNEGRTSGPSSLKATHLERILIPQITADPNARDYALEIQTLQALARFMESIDKRITAIERALQVEAEET